MTITFVHLAEGFSQLEASELESFSTYSPSSLRCDYLNDPKGIDNSTPALSWRLSDEMRSQSAYQIQVASSAQGLNNDDAVFWDSEKVSSGKTINVSYQGKPLRAFDKCFWRVRVWNENDQVSDWSEPAFFGIGPIEETDWNGAAWISTPKEAASDNFPLLRKTFTLESVPTTAMAYINVLGYFELYVNDQKISDDILSPAVSDYSKNSLYVGYDISDYLRKGENSITLWIAHGWYRINVSDYYGVTEDRPLARALFRMETDGHPETFSTDSSWQYQLSNRSIQGSWRWGNFGGETFQLNTPEDVANWQPVKTFDPPEVPAIAQRNNPTVVLDTLRAKSITTLANNDILIDFGKHFTGWINLRLANLLTDTVEVEYLDKLFNAPESNMDPIEKNVSKPLEGDEEGRSIIAYNQKDIIVGAPGSSGSFQNKFNYHAFRWVIIRGVEGLDKEDLFALLIGEDIPQVTEFSCSSPLLNDVWSTVNHTYRSLAYSGYVVDCPHRERLGYGADGNASIEAAMSNFDVAALYRKWSIDWNNSMSEEGLWMHTAPLIPSHEGKFTPAWGGFGMVLPWQLYVYYGDKESLSNAYPFIKRWMKTLNSHVGGDGILYPDTTDTKALLWSFHGDWLAPPYGMMKPDRVDETSTWFFNNCYYLYNLQLASKIATVLENAQDVKRYHDWYAFSRPKIHKKFFNEESGDYANGEQTYQAFPLYTGLVPDDLRQAADSNLEYLILDKNDGHLNTGMLGTYYLFNYLMERERNDLIYTMVSQETFPGWGYMLKNGATTIWEQWNGENSQIHNCHLSVGKWFAQGLGGIRPDEENPGFSHFYIVPGIVDELEFANVSYDTQKGLIVSNWKKSEDKVQCEVVVPPNTQATFVVPKNSISAVSLNGTQASMKDQSGAFAGRRILLEPGRHVIIF